MTDNPPPRPTWLEEGKRRHDRWYVDGLVLTVLFLIGMGVLVGVVIGKLVYS